MIEKRCQWAFIINSLTTARSFNHLMTMKSNLSLPVSIDSSGIKRVKELPTWSRQLTYHHYRSALKMNVLMESWSGSNGSRRECVKMASELAFPFFSHKASHAARHLTVLLLPLLTRGLPALRAGHAMSSRCDSPALSLQEYATIAPQNTVNTKRIKAKAAELGSILLWTISFLCTLVRPAHHLQYLTGVCRNGAR